MNPLNVPGIKTPWGLDKDKIDLQIKVTKDKNKVGKADGETKEPPADDKE